MQKICELGNHIATFHRGHWGACSAMTCSWLRKVKNGVQVKNRDDMGSTGSLILAQIKAHKDFEETGDKLYTTTEIFFRFDLRWAGKHSMHRAGKGKKPEYSHRDFAQALAKDGMHYASLVFADGDQHAVGVWAKKGGPWQFLDANFDLEQTADENDFRAHLVSRLEMYNVVKATIYTVN